MRKDGRLMNELDSFYKFYTYLMPRRVEASCWTLLHADASELIKLIDEKKQSGEEITVFHIIVAALIRTASMYPELNRFIYGHKFYARKDYTVSFAVNTDEKTVFRKVWLDPADTLLTVSEKISASVTNARLNPDDSLDDSVKLLVGLPRFITSFITRSYPFLVDKGIFPKKFVDDDVLFSSAIVSNLGTMGIGAPMHHLYDWGNASVFVTVGAIKKIPVALPDGTIKAADIIDFGFTIDERICDGKKLSDALCFFEYCIENPRTLEQSPGKVVRE